MTSLTTERRRKEQYYATDISINKFDNGNLIWFNNQYIVQSY